MFYCFSFFFSIDKNISGDFWTSGWMSSDGWNWYYNHATLPIYYTYWGATHPRPIRQHSNHTNNQHWGIVLSSTDKNNATWKIRNSHDTAMMICEQEVHTLNAQNRQLSEMINQYLLLTNTNPNHNYQSSTENSGLNYDMNWNKNQGNLNPPNTYGQNYGMNKELKPTQTYGTNKDFKESYTHITQHSGQEDGLEDSKRSWKEWWKAFQEGKDKLTTIMEEFQLNFAYLQSVDKNKNLNPTQTDQQDNSDHTANLNKVKFPTTDGPEADSKDKGLQTDTGSRIPTQSPNVNSKNNGLEKDNRDGLTTQGPEIHSKNNGLETDKEVGNL